MQSVTWYIFYFTLTIARYSQKFVMGVKSYIGGGGPSPDFHESLLTPYIVCRFKLLTQT